MQQKRVLKRPAISVPQNIEEAGGFLRKMRELEKEMQVVQIEVDEKVAEIREKAKVKIKARQDIIQQYFEGIFIFAQARKEELTEQGKRKTVTIPPDCFGWRYTPEKVVLEDEEAIMAELKKLGQAKFIRVKEEINKEAMHDDKELALTVKGVSFEQHEEFVVKLAEVELEIARDIQKLLKKKTISKMISGEG